MSKFLLDEPSLQVQPSLAIAIGLNEAIALQQLHWVLQNPAMGKVVDGKKYVHMSFKEWKTGHFPFWSTATIQRAFDTLIKKKLVESRGDLNTLSFDRTHWYTINHAEVAKVEESLKTNERVIEHSKMINGHRKMRKASKQDETTIPDASVSESSAPESSSACGAKDAPPTDKDKEPEKPTARRQNATVSPQAQERIEQARAALEEFGRKNDVEIAAAAAIASPVESERVFVRRVAPMIAALFPQRDLISDDRVAAKRVYALRADAAWLEERLTAYANGQGDEFTHPAKDGQQPNSFWVWKRLEKEWSIYRKEKADAEQREREQADYERRVAAALASVSPSEQDGGRSHSDSVHLHDPTRGPVGNAVCDAAGQAGIAVATGGNVRVRGDGLGVLPMPQPPVGAEDRPGETPERSRSLREMYRNRNVRGQMATVDARVSEQKRSAA